jgi:LmeA-like phospholipid-binding
MTSDRADLGNQALSKVAEIGITNQLDGVENIDVDIRTDPGKLIQGKVDSVVISGRGMVMKQDLRMEALTVSIDRVAINPLSAIFGNIELTQPSDAEALIVLTQADLNRAFSSEYVHSKLQRLQMEMDGHPVTIDVQQVTIELPGENKLCIAADFVMKEQGELKKMSAVAIPEIEEDGNRIALEILSAEGQGLNLRLVMAIFEQLIALLDLRNFNFPGMSFQLHKLEAQADRLVIHAHARVAQIPAM